MEVASLQKLGQWMDRVQHQSFSNVYEKIWDLEMKRYVTTQGCLGFNLWGKLTEMVFFQTKYYFRLFFKLFTRAGNSSHVRFWWCW